jgi:hypothetical protein
MCILSMVSPTICILYFLHYHLSFLIFELIYSLNITRHAQNGVSIRISTNPILLSYQKNFFLLLSPNQSISLWGIIPITTFSIVSGLASSINRIIISSFMSGTTAIFKSTSKKSRTHVKNL